jgi:putative copper resistance protein D
MTVTLAHVLGATVWAGGIMHLLLFWRWARRDPQAAASWPELVSRFSPLGIVSVTLLIAPGLYLAWRYLGDWGGLVGTSYGNLLVVKIVLFAGVLVLARFNFWATRRWRQTGDSLVLAQRVPAYIEVELVLASALLFTAATLASFPPAADLLNDRVSSADMWRMFNPKVPHLGGPEIIHIEAPEQTDMQTGRIGQQGSLSWDRFNHNMSGVIVASMALVALLNRIGGVPWARHWPLLFIAFSVLIFVFSNPTEWPLGQLGFRESLQNAEVVQHWLAAIVVLGLGWFEWRARLGKFANQNLRYVFPVLCIVGGIILLTHSHDISEVRQEFLAQSTHVAMGALAVIMGCSRWLELRFASPQNRMAAVISLASMLLVGFILMFYVDPEDLATWSKLK